MKLYFTQASRGTKILNCYDVELTTVINVCTKRTEDEQNITSIFRKGSMKSPENYSPSFLTSAVNKIAVQTCSNKFDHLDYYTVLGK